MGVVAELEVTFVFCVRRLFFFGFFLGLVFYFVFL